MGLTYTVDPAVTLRRIGPAADAGRTTIVETVPDEVGPTNIECADDVSAWTGLAHIGLEAVHIGAAVGTTTFQVSMNKAKWDSLPKDVQKAFNDASGPEWWQEAGKIWMGSDEIGLKLVKANKNNYIVLNKAQTDAFRTALEPVAERWVKEVSAKGINGKAMLEEARALVQKYSKK